ncbi:MAG: nodulation protein NfeD [Actinomycetota bacterium]|nr:nodulation protein NfeD [Actinomycetota bacterium]
MKWLLLRAFFASLGVALAFSAPALGAEKPRVLAVHFALEINPITQDYVNHQIDRAQTDNYDAVVILLDTPGGLSSSMEKIYEKELASKIPVIVFVAPKGAGAASAGVFVAQAADLLAMAPGTNIGSSTPINSNGGNLNSDLRRKTINHFAAKLRSLAKEHGRNVQWADDAVRKASNLTADEALARHVIDVKAGDLPTLLRKVDGWVTKPNHYKLQLAGARIDEVHPGFLTRLLNTLIDPNLIPLLFLAGIAGIGYEVFHPGVVLPGALGGVSLLTALFGFSILPVSWAGLALVLLGIGLLVLEAHFVSHGTLAISGLISLGIGMAMLFRNAPTTYRPNLPLLLSVALVLGAAWAFALKKALEVRRQPVAVGAGTMAGAIGEVRRDGLVFVRGELWQARRRDGEPLRPGEHVRVDAVNGLVLDVEPVEAPEGAGVT